MLLKPLEVLKEFLNILYSKEHTRKRKTSFGMGLNSDKCYEEKEGENSMVCNESGARSLGKFKRTRLSGSTRSSCNNSQLTSAYKDACHTLIFIYKVLMNESNDSIFMLHLLYFKYSLV